VDKLELPPVLARLLSKVRPELPPAKSHNRDRLALARLPSRVNRLELPLVPVRPPSRDSRPPSRDSRPPSRDSRPLSRDRLVLLSVLVRLLSRDRLVLLSVLVRLLSRDRPEPPLVLAKPLNRDSRPLSRDRLELLPVPARPPRAKPARQLRARRARRAKAPLEQPTPPLRTPRRRTKCLALATYYEPR
jgi:hypothetical protein